MNDIERFRRRRENRLLRRGIRLDAEWEEEKHPRGKNGQFTSGSGTGDTGTEKKPKSPILKTGKTIGGTKLPKLKEGAEWSKRVATADEGAKKDGFTKEFDKAIKNLKPEDILYQTDSDGKVFASVPGLMAKIDNKLKFKDRPEKSEACKKIYATSLKAEKGITKDMLDLSKQLGTCMSGLEFSMKSGSHFAEKIDRKREKFEEKNPGMEISDEEIAKGMTDNIRYTMLIKHDDIPNKFNDVVKGLEDKGYEIVEVDNKFVQKGDKPVNYKGVHILAQKDGQTVELQLHSNETDELKDKNHEIYELYEGKDGKKRTQEEKDKLNEEMIENAKKIRNPKGIENIKDYKKR